MCESGDFFVIQDRRGWQLLDSMSKKVVLEAHYDNHLLHIADNRVSSNAAMIQRESPEILHRRFAYRVHPKELTLCADCVNAKAIRKPICEGLGRVDEICMVIDSDLSNKMPIPSRDGYQYWATFIDNRSRFVRIYFLKNKSEALRAFKNFVHWIERKTGLSNDSDSIEVENT